MKIDWSNPTIVAALVAGVFAIVAACVQLLKKNAGGKSASQSATMSSGTTQIMAGRDVHQSRATDADGTSGGRR